MIILYCDIQKCLIIDVRMRVRHIIPKSVSLNQAIRVIRVAHKLHNPTKITHRGG